jgi:hypothetical protein
MAARSDHSDLTICNWTDEFCNCRDLGTTHCLGTEEDLCERHYWKRLAELPTAAMAVGLKKPAAKVGLALPRSAEQIRSAAADFPDHVLEKLEPLDLDQEFFSYPTTSRTCCSLMYPSIRGSSDHCLRMRSRRRPAQRLHTQAEFPTFH